MNHIVLRPASNSMAPICDPGDARAIIRAGEYARQTAGIAPEYVHGNLCIVPKELALDFAAFCQRNPKPRPLIGLGSPGNPTLPDLGDLDIRTDLPRYCVFKDGNLVDEPTDVRTLLVGRSRHFRARLLNVL
jgi:uncharacterized protein YcsI (UPF0317 family)